MGKREEEEESTVAAPARAKQGRKQERKGWEGKRKENLQLLLLDGHRANSLALALTVQREAAPPQYLSEITVGQGMFLNFCSSEMSVY